jgi:hypothetical protein
MITEEELALTPDYTDAEKALMLGALNLSPGPNAEAELMESVGTAMFAGLPLNVLLHALAEKESTFRPAVIGHEKDGSLAFGLFQFHQPTALPILAKIGHTWDEFLTSVDVQVQTVIELLNQDLKRSGGDVRGAFRQFGAHTRKVIYPIIEYLEKKPGP